MDAGDRSDRFGPSPRAEGASEASYGQNLEGPPGSGEHDTNAEGSGKDAGERPDPSRRRWMYIAIAVGVAIIVVATAFAVVATEHNTTSNGSTGTVLVPAGTLETVGDDQWSAVIFAQKASVSVEGMITNIGGAQIYVMTPLQYFTLVNTYNLTGYEWTSGPITSDTYYALQVTIPAGSWDLVFGLSEQSNSGAIGFYSNLVETS